MGTLRFEKTVFDQAMEKTNAWNFELAVEKLLELKADQWDLSRAQAAVQNYKRWFPMGISTKSGTCIFLILVLI